MNKMTEIITREDVLKAATAVHTRNITAVAEELLVTKQEFKPIIASGQEFLIRSLLNEVKGRSRQVLKTLNLGELVYLHNLGGPVYCDPREWELGPVDVMMQEHPSLHNQSNYVQSRNEYVTSWELMEQHHMRMEVEAGLDDHAADVTERRREYHKAASKDWRSIINKYKQGKN